MPKQSVFNLKQAASLAMAGMAVFLFLATIVTFNPAKVFAQSFCEPNTTDEHACSSDGGHLSSDGTYCICPGAPGADCSPSVQCNTGLVCTSGKCVTNTGDSAHQPNKYPVPTGDVPTVSNGSCGTTDTALIKLIQSTVGATQNGTCTPSTIAAVQRWQNKAGLTDDGIVGTNTLSAMGLTPANGGGTPPPAGSVTCPEGLTASPGSGLCLPKDTPFKTGIAGSTSLSALLVTVIQLLLYFAGAIAVVILVIGGFWYITSAGNEETAEKGKKTIINAIIGIVVVVLAYAIINIISNTLTTSQFSGH